MEQFPGLSAVSGPAEGLEILGGGASNNLVGIICHCPGCIRVSQNLRKKNAPLHPSSASLVDDFYYLVQWFQVQRKRTVSVVAY